MSDNRAGQRKRGIRASRSKLTRALAECGLKSQAALAERIADIENLDTAPKDMVNRVFRELPVELLTLERVAKALSVPAHTLYKSADENERQNVSAASAEQAAQKVNWLTVSLGFMVVLLAGFLWFSDSNSEDGGSDRQPLNVQLDLGALTLVVMPVTGDRNAQFGNALRAALADKFNVASATVSGLTTSMSSQRTADLLRVDATIDAEIVVVGRLQAIRVFMLAEGVRRQIWAESVPRGNYALQLPSIVNNTQLAVWRTFDKTGTTAESAHFPLAPTQDDYLEGERHLDRPSSELNLRRAQSRFEAALRQDANYALAHAGLCQSLLEEHWMDDEERALKDAARACGQALQLNPDHPVVSAAYAHFLHRTGRRSEAIEQYKKTLQSHPSDSAALTGLSAAQLDAYRATGDKEDLRQAKASARMAAQVDPFIWKSLFNLAVMEWMDDNLDAAIAASEQALMRDENEFLLGNLGTFYICLGDFKKAHARYQRAKDLAPASYIGDEYLGMAEYYLGNFEESASLRQSAINSISGGNPEIHEMWGNLADSYRQSGQVKLATAAYLRAAEIAERDYLRGTRPAADAAARAYYYAMLDQLAPAGSQKQVPVSELDDISANLTEATAHRRMAAVWHHRGDITKAKQERDKATQTCPGYGRFPDLLVLDDS